MLHKTVEGPISVIPIFVLADIFRHQRGKFHDNLPFKSENVEGDATEANVKYKHFCNMQIY